MANPTEAADLVTKAKLVDNETKSWHKLGSKKVKRLLLKNGEDVQKVLGYVRTIHAQEAVSDGFPTIQDFLPIQLGITAEIQIRSLIGMIQSGETTDEIERLLAYYSDSDESRVQKLVNESVENVPAIFYIVATRDVRLIRIWAKYGANVNVVWAITKLPLLAFAILHGGETSEEAASIVTTLLTLGASPHVIPRAFYDPYNRDLPLEFAKEELHDADDDNKVWCTPMHRKGLKDALNLTQRYRLFEATRMQAPSSRYRMVAKRRGVPELLGIRHTIIGQEDAAERLREWLIINLTESEGKPLVFVFAGPSGHGKTELARSLGSLLNTDMTNIDCTNHKSSHTFFGPIAPYCGSTEGSPLNNFLVRTSGQRCVVFLDEFEKTDREIHNNLLVVFQDGEYTDRRDTLVSVDVKKSIWVLATNAFDDHILQFCRENEDALSRTDDARGRGKLYESLQKQLIGLCKDKFGSAMTGRIDTVLPFLTFTPNEQAVVAHKKLMDLEKRLKKPVVVSANGEGDNLVGNINLNINQESKLCTWMSKASYDPQLGARSIFSVVNAKVKVPLFMEYLKKDTGITNNQAETTANIGIDRDDEIQVWMTEEEGGNEELDTSM
ncbi:P-loop containing nucleoside triphosphate hydrolase protein [Xylariaceae sp. FL1272]|nr:P-loop containing nucleoside triphosphate hydrolase protein [Xylariaceae sp. FL1272]